MRGRLVPKTILHLLKEILHDRLRKASKQGSFLVSLFTPLNVNILYVLLFIYLYIYIYIYNMHMSHRKNNNAFFRVIDIQMTIF